MYVTKRAVFTTFTLTTVGVTTYLLSNKDKRKRVLDKIKKVYNPFITFHKNNYDSRLIKKAGHPHPHDEGDNNMVSEGAMYSVNYYNEQENK
jgi:hypothetical protein